MRNYETPLNVLLLTALAVITVLMASSLVRSVPDAVVANVEQPLPEKPVVPAPPSAPLPLVTENQAKPKPAVDRPKVTASLNTLQSLIATRAEAVPQNLPTTPSQEDRQVPQKDALNLLVEGSALAGSVSTHQVKVLDVRPWDKYRQRHVPGAVCVDINEWAQAFKRSEPRSSWEKRIGALGIDLEAPIVICDDGSFQNAACLWAILRYWGAKDVQLLNGGWPAWLYAGAYQDDAEPSIAQRAVRIRPNPARLVSKEQLIDLIQTRREQVIDSSSASREKAGSNSVISLPWNGVVDWREARFNSMIELNRLFHSAGIDLGRPAVVYGDSLDQAAALAFALELAGAKNVRLHFPGWDR
jgi:thiosulfate/3-mercaptopyruvate sulfurtransferase